jgi:hypothetical protein
LTVLACTCELTANSLVKLTSNHSHCSFRSVIKLSRLTLTKPIDTVEISWVIFLVQVVQGTIHQIDIAVEDLERDHFFVQSEWMVCSGRLPISISLSGVCSIFRTDYDYPWSVKTQHPHPKHPKTRLRLRLFLLSHQVGFFRRRFRIDAASLGLVDEKKFFVMKWIKGKTLRKISHK